MLNDKKFILPGLYQLLEDYLKDDRDNLENLMSQQFLGVGQLKEVREAARGALKSTALDQAIDPYNYETAVKMARDALKQQGQTPVQPPVDAPKYDEMKRKVAEFKKSNPD